jgi:hypothetical protein
VLLYSHDIDLPVQRSLAAHIFSLGTLAAVLLILGAAVVAAGLAGQLLVAAVPIAAGEADRTALCFTRFLTAVKAIWTVALL